MKFERVSPWRCYREQRRIWKEISAELTQYPDYPDVQRETYRLVGMFTVYGFLLITIGMVFLEVIF